MIDLNPSPSPLHQVGEWREKFQLPGWFPGPILRSFPEVTSLTQTQVWFKEVCYEFLKDTFVILSLRKSQGKKKGNPKGFRDSAPDMAKTKYTFLL